jgi:hypothetical protein
MKITILTNGLVQTQLDKQNYPSLDIYKNKSNWGQTGINMVIDI